MPDPAAATAPKRGSSGWSALLDLLYARASVFDLVGIADGDPVPYCRKLAATALAARLYDLEAKTGCLTGWETVLA